MLPNISTTKGNQKTKHCQLIEYNMRNIFLKNHTKIMVEKLFPHPFVRK